MTKEFPGYNEEDLLNIPVDPETGEKVDVGQTLVPRVIGDKSCDATVVGGRPHYRYDWVPKSQNDDVSFDDDIKKLLKDECEPWYYYNVKFGNIQTVQDVLTGGDVISNGGTHVLSGKKNLPFDMPHPNKKGWRLRHVCIEGPEIAVYCRGKVPEDGIINLPSYWEGLINPEDMTINITPMGHWQELFVKEIRWGKQVVVRNNAGGAINANYHIIARRLDDDLIVEYEGENYTDYPGGNEGYSFNYEHNYVESLIKDTVEKTVKRITET